MSSKSLVQVDIREVIKICENLLKLIKEERIYLDKMRVIRFKNEFEKSLTNKIRKFLGKPNLSPDEIHKRIIKQEEDFWGSSYPSYRYSDQHEMAKMYIDSLQKAMFRNKDSYKTEVQMSVEEFNILTKLEDKLEKLSKSNR
jgi:hypothetical protein